MTPGACAPRTAAHPGRGIQKLFDGASVILRGFGLIFIKTLVAKA